MTKKENCQHEEYCGLSENVCKETDFPETCRMKDSDIEDMPILRAVKERVERDKAQK